MCLIGFVIVCRVMKVKSIFFKKQSFVRINDFTIQNGSGINKLTLKICAQAIYKLNLHKDLSKSSQLV